MGHFEFQKWLLLKYIFFSENIVSQLINHIFYIHSSTIFGNECKNYRKSSLGHVNREKNVSVNALNQEHSHIKFSYQTFNIPSFKPGLCHIYDTCVWGLKI